MKPLEGAPPPQGHARGARPALDRAWLAYLREAGRPPEPSVPHTLLSVGMAQFNDARFFEAHETWERAWRQVPYAERLFYLALTKLATGYAHAQRGNLAGARRLLADSIAFLAPFTPRYLGVDTALLLMQALGWLAAHAPRMPEKPARRPDLHRDASSPRSRREPR